MKFSNWDQRASTEPNSLPTLSQSVRDASQIEKGAHRNDALQISVQPVDVLKDLLHALDSLATVSIVSRITERKHTPAISRTSSSRCCSNTVGEEDLGFEMGVVDILHKRLTDLYWKETMTDQGAL